MSSIVCLQFATRYNTLHSMDLHELQIDDILRYLGEDDNQESAPIPPTPNVPTSSPQPSSPSTCRTTLNSRMATPFQGQRGSTKLYYSNHTYTKRATRDGSHIWRCTNRKCKGAMRTLLDSYEVFETTPHSSCTPLTESDYLQILSENDIVCDESAATTRNLTVIPRDSTSEDGGGIKNHHLAPPPAPQIENYPEFKISDV